MGFKTIKFREKYEKLLSDNKRMNKKLIELNSKLQICEQKYLSIESALDLSQKLVQHLKTENHLLRFSQMSSASDIFPISIPMGPISPPMVTPMTTLAITDGTEIGDPLNMATNQNQLTDNNQNNSDLCKSDLIAVQYEKEIKEFREECDLLSVLPLDSVLISYEDQINANSHLSEASESEYECNDQMDVDTDVISSKMSETSEVKTELKCKYCGKKFPEESVLKAHKDLHKSSDEKQIRCAEDFCGHQFDSKHDLKKHLKNIHKNRDKNTKYSSLKAKFEMNFNQNKNHFECKQCNTDFTSIESLRSHQKSVHNIVSTFKCKFSGCEQKFEKSSELRAHEEIHRKQKSIIEFKQTPTKSVVLSENNKESKPTPTPPPPVPVKRQFVCKVEGCNSSYLHKTSLKKHEEKYHPNSLVPVLGAVEPTNTLTVVGPAEDIGTKLQLLNLFFSEQQKQVQL